MRTKRIVFSLLLSAYLLTCLIQMSVFAEEQTFLVANEEEFLTSVQKINAADGGAYNIRLLENITVNAEIEFTKNE